MFIQELGKILTLKQHIESGKGGSPATSSNSGGTGKTDDSEDLLNDFADGRDEDYLKDEREMMDSQAKYENEN